MGNEPDGPYYGTMFGLWQKKMNWAWNEGRKSRDGLREALRGLISWASDCYCLIEEEACRPGGKTCPLCVAKEALEADEKEGK